MIAGFTSFCRVHYVLFVDCIMTLFFFFLMIRRPPRSTRTDTSFPTRRSSDLHHPHGDCTRAADFGGDGERSEEHTSELQSLMRISYAVFCLKKKTNT